MSDDMCAMMNYLPNYLRCSAIIRLTARGSVTMIFVEGGFIPHRGQQKWLLLSSVWEVMLQYNLQYNPREGFKGLTYIDNPDDVYSKISHY